MVLDRLVELLDERWHIYVQPAILNMHPDFLIAAPHHGVTIIEVKDWKQGGHRNESGRLMVRDPNGSWAHTSEDPLGQAHTYKSRINDSLISTPSENMYTSVRSTVILPKWRSRDIEALLRNTTHLQENHHRWIAAVGSEVFEKPANRNLLRLLIYGGRRIGAGISESVWQRLAARLDEPEAIAEQRQSLKLSIGARNVALNPSKATTRRVRGATGSGKTIGLAARAAQLASEGKQVLVLSFNITLSHYIQDQVRRHARMLRANPRLVDCIHIHGFCSDVVTTAGETLSGITDPDDIIALAESIYRTKRGHLKKYDAILVDEGQDFQQEWWNFLRKEVRRNDQSEMLLVADATQDIYERKSWVDEAKMTACGFKGPWTSLDGCYRMPVDLIPIVSEFAERYLDRDLDLPTVPTDHTGIASEPTIRIWRNEVGRSNRHLADVVLAEVTKIINEEGVHSGDCAILVNDHTLGLAVAENFGDDLEHIFSEDLEDRQRRKKRFWPGVAMLKGSTVHSFKGWEARAIIVVISATDPDQGSSPRDLAYVALSRAKGAPGNRSAFITVINTLPELADFKQRFERDIAINEVPQLGGQARIGL